MKLSDIIHLYKRAGFGLSRSELEAVRPLSKDEILRRIFDAALSEEDELKIDLTRDIQVPTRDFSLPLYEERRAKQDRRALLQNVWLDWMLESPAFLKEKMALFWHHHMPMGGQNFTLTKLYLEILRKHALGKFRDLLFAVAKTPAMMRYLDNHHSHKDAPNENWPRELMELFTLGVDNYTLDDIKEAARAFTGWRYDHDINVFYLDEEAHDDGVKVFLGRRGHFGGEDIMDIILEQRQCARHLVRAVWKFFVCAKYDEEIIAQLASDFYDSGYDIGKLMLDIFSSDWFYEQRFRNSLIKTPVELLVGFQKQTGAKLVGIKTHDYLMRMMGQRLFAPPNVGGWPEGKEWITTSTILFRTRFPVLVFRIANRNISRESITYKVSSRLDAPEFRRYRYFMDAVFDREQFERNAAEMGVPLAMWFWGAEEVPECLSADASDDLLYFLTHYRYQLN